MIKRKRYVKANKDEADMDYTGKQRGRKRREGITKETKENKERKESDRQVNTKDKKRQGSKMQGSNKERKARKR